MKQFQLLSIGLVLAGCVVANAVPVVMLPYSNTQVMNQSDLTLLFLNHLRYVPFLVVSVTHTQFDRLQDGGVVPTQLDRLMLPRKPILVRGQQRRSDVGEEIMRGFYPEMEYIVVEPLDALPVEPDQFPGTYDMAPYRAAREKIMEEGLARIARGGGSWFLIKRIPRSDGVLVRKEDYVLETVLMGDRTADTAQNRVDVRSVQLVRRAQTISHAEPVRTTVIAVPSPVAAYLAAHSEATQSEVE